MIRIGVVALAAVISAFGIAAVAQQQKGSSNEPSSQPSQNQPCQPGTMGGGMMGMGTMGQMGNHHQQMVDNMNKLMQSMSAIEAEKDPAELKQKLAAHKALLEQMRSQMMQQGEMMQQMQHMMGGPGNTQPPASK
jgi:hypothetical protein